MNKNITLIGDSIGNTTGYQMHCRGLAKAFIEKGYDVCLKTNLYQGWEAHIEDWLYNIINKEDKKELYIFIGLPPFNRQYLNNKPKIYAQYVVWEGEYVPKYWEKYLVDKNVDLIFVPSEHTKQALINTFNNEEIIKKTFVIPHGIDLSLFYNLYKKKDIFRFVSNKGFSNLWEDRGGLAYTIRAFREEFKEGEAELIVKVNAAYSSPEKIQNDVKQIIGDIKGGRVKVMTQNVPEKELVHIYNEGYIFVSSSRAESFNIPVLEAMACGLPAIVTGYSGHCDFVKDNVNGLYINYKLNEVKFDLNYEGSLWATPDLEDLKKKMRYAFNNQDKLKQMSEEAMKTAKQYTWKNTVEKIEKAIEELQ